MPVGCVHSILPRGLTAIIMNNYTDLIHYDNIP